MRPLGKGRLIGLLRYIVKLHVMLKTVLICFLSVATHKEMEMKAAGASSQEQVGFSCLKLLFILMCILIHISLYKSRKYQYIFK